MWDGVTWGGPVTYMDIDPSVEPDLVGDFRSMPIEDSSVDVLVFDPPHLPTAAASPLSMGHMVRNYGLDRAHTGDDMASAVMSPFLVEARRVLKDGGVIIAKLKDHVHNHKYRWILADWVCAVWEAGLVPCDLRVKIDPCGGNLKSGRWKRAHHARNAHCWWAIVRKGRCEPVVAREIKADV
jgi:hypothetical protein